MREVIPRGNGDGVYTGRELHTSKETTMAEYGKTQSAPKEKPATAEEIKWIETAAKRGEQLTLQEARKQMKKYGAIGVIFLLVFFGGCVRFISSQKDDPLSRATERCRLTAHLHTSEQGASTYTFAEGVSPTSALLHFRHPKSGRTWTTNYFCD